MDEIAAGNESKYPVNHGAPLQAKAGGTSNRDWWPNQLKLGILHQNSPLSDPMGDCEANVLGTLTLLDAVALALEYHPAIGEARAQAESATVELIEPDVLPYDNRAELLLTSPTRQRVLLISDAPELRTRALTTDSSMVGSGRLLTRDVVYVTALA